MKFTKYIITALLAFSLPALAQQTVDTGYTVWASGGAQFNASGLTNYAVMPDFSKIANGQPVLNYLNATSDKTGSVVQFFTPAGFTSIYGTNQGFFTNLTTTSNYYIGATNFMAIGTNILIKHNIMNGPPTYELAQVFGLGTTVGTNITGPPSAPVTNFLYAITNTTALVTAVLPGDIVFPLVPNGNIPIVTVNTALSLSGGTTGGIYAGKQGQPVLLEITGGTNATINAISGSFSP